MPCCLARSRPFQSVSAYSTVFPKFAYLPSGKFDFQFCAAVNSSFSGQFENVNMEYRIVLSTLRNPQAAVRLDEGTLKSSKLTGIKLNRKYHAIIHIMVSLLSFIERS